MSEGFEDPDARWRVCEVEWAKRLRLDGWAVIPLAESTRNIEGTPAPMGWIGEDAVRLPDLQATKAGISQYWEVKYRTRSTPNPLTADAEHWMSFAALCDYRAWQSKTGQLVRIALFEAGHGGAGLWLVADIDDLLAAGRQISKSTGAGEMVDAWIWPSSAMRVTSGPMILQDAPLLPVEGDHEPLDPRLLRPLERSLRRPRPAAIGSPPPPLPAPMEPELLRMMDDEPQVGLQLLAESLGLPRPPQYSVLRIDPDPEELEDLIGLTTYGIRVFIVGSAGRLRVAVTPEIAALKAAQILQVSFVGDIDCEPCWVIDGEGVSDAVRGVLRAAEDRGGINAAQFEIIHAPAEQDIAIIAGAGTGKTETMAERILFLLSTGGQGLERKDGDAPHAIGLADFCLITFTREAAREMSSRLTRSLTLRRRLAPRCIHPVVGWLLQLRSMTISTIHSLASDLLRRYGSSIGISPSFRVSTLTMERREILREAAAGPLTEIFGSPGSHDLPAEHLWIRHLEKLIEKLESNGIDLSDPRWGPEEGRLLLGGQQDDGAEVPAVVEEILHGFGERFRSTMLRRQALSADRLVPSALRAVEATPPGRLEGPRFVFVDEFQDTDTTQIDFILSLRSLLGSRLYVVGDPKQGVYRFRGAEGSAFTELQDRAGDDLGRLVEHRLTRNFRSDPVLLAQLDGIFLPLGRRDLLEYASQDRLKADPSRSGGRLSMGQPWVWSNDDAMGAALEAVKGLKAGQASDSIALICRTNRQALNLREHLRADGIACEILVGGQFYRTPAVLEVRALLEGICDPRSLTAAAELLETRWANGLLSARLPLADGNALGQGGAGGTRPSPRSWRARLVEADAGSQIPVEDLDVIRDRLDHIATMARSRPAISLLADLASSCAPANCKVMGDLGDDVAERERYLRCLNHLMHKLVETFGGGPATLAGILEWLRLQIATNASEDEPADPEIESSKSQVIAVTVHRSKGLEFDHVIVPFTSTPFGSKGSKVETLAAIMRDREGRAELIWRWRPSDGSMDIVDSASAAAWEAEDLEVLREEVRLLYVALTRARHSLSIFRKPSKAESLSSWADVLGLGGG